MDNLESRLKGLEKRVAAPEDRERKPPTLVLLPDEPLPPDIPPGAMIVYVVNEQAKQATEAILRGERTE